MRLFLAVLIVIAPVAFAGAVLTDQESADGATITLATQLYSSDVHVYPASSEEFSSLFPAYRLYGVTLVDAPPRLVHLMAVSPSDVAYNFTSDFNALLSSVPLLVLTEEDALRLAELYAELANADLQFSRRVVGADDSAALGATIDDPVANTVVGGWDVRLTTWSPENGVLANWTMRIESTRLGEAAWTVSGVAVGGYELEPHALNFRAQTTVENDYDDGYKITVTREPGGEPAAIAPYASWSKKTGLCVEQILASGLNFDGTEWQVCYVSYSEEPLPETAIDDAAHLRDAAVEAYNKMVHHSDATCAGATNGSSWGFTAGDPDCVNYIAMTTPNALAYFSTFTPTHTYNVYLDIGADYRVGLLPYGVYTNPLKHTPEALARTIVAHEFFHALQHKANDNRYVATDTGWWTQIEGMARLVQTLVAPDAEHDPSSLWFYNSNQAQSQTWLTFCQSGLEKYNSARYWGYLYQNHGGIDTLRRSLTSTFEVGSRDCWDGLPMAVNAALGDVATSTETHNRVWSDFVLANYLANLSWGAPGETTTFDWDVFTTGPADQPPLDDGSRKVESNSASFVRLPTTGTYTVTCAQTGGLNMRFFIRNLDDSVTSSGFTCDDSRTFDASASAEVVLVATLATSSDKRSYTLVVT